MRTRLSGAVAAALTALAAAAVPATGSHGVRHTMPGLVAQKLVAAGRP